MEKVPSHLERRLDKIADELTSRGLYKLAADVDTVSNSLMEVSPSLGIADIKVDDLVTSILLSGGTQGDEMAGIALIQEFQQNPVLVQRPGLDVQLQISNPEAVNRCVHYIDDDLNNCFGMDSLTESSPSKYEVRRAQEIFQKFGSKKGNLDLVVDFHNTTANMGITLIIGRLNPFLCKLVATLANRYPDDIKVLFSPEVQETSTCLDSLGRSGLTVEVGPLKHGHYLDRTEYLKTRQIAVDIMDFVVNWNAGNIEKTGVSVPVYRHVQTIEYVTDAAKRKRLSEIAPSLIGKDYHPMSTGDIMQYDIVTGTPIYYHGVDTVYPVFIDETSPTYREPWKDDEAMDLTWLSYESW